MPSNINSVDDLANFSDKLITNLIDKRLGEEALL